jgi:hypothetical protein
VIHGPALAVLATLLIEVPLVVWLLPGPRPVVLLVAVVANVATNLFLNVALPHFVLCRPHALGIGETLAVVVEALAYYCVSRPREAGRALFVSGLANAASYSGGPLVAAAVVALTT